MATTGKINGTDILLYIGGTAVSHSTNCTVNLTMATIGVSSKDSVGWTDKLASIRDWNGSCDGMITLDGTFGIEQIYGAMNARTSVTVKFATDDATDRFFSGSAFITALNNVAPHEGGATFSMSFEGTGKLKFAKT